MDGRRGLMMARRSSTQVANVGDIAYKAPNGKIMVVAQDLWDASLGTPVGVVVIPSGFAPDNGLARIVSLYWASSSSTSSTSASSMRWSNTNKNTSLTNYTVVPTTNNTTSTVTSANTSGFLPADRFTGSTSYVDPIAKYFEGTTSYLVPSPYLGNTPNPAYYTELSGQNNALADFDGKGNTDVLVALGSAYYAANAARNYKAAGAEEIEWYLPSMGELGYLIARFNKIEAALALASASKLDATITFWTSTENSTGYAFVGRTDNGNISSYSKSTAIPVRPFAMLDF